MLRVVRLKLSEHARLQARRRGIEEEVVLAVTGASSADGSPGAHILWDAYHTSLDRSEVVEHYLDLLGADDHEKKADCDTWRIPGDGTTRLLDVCDAESRCGPWNKCDPPPEDAKCILLLAMMIGGD